MIKYLENIEPYSLWLFPMLRLQGVIGCLIIFVMLVTEFSWTFWVSTAFLWAIPVLIAVSFLIFIFTLSIVCVLYALWESFSDFIFNGKTRW